MLGRKPAQPSRPAVKKTIGEVKSGERIGIVTDIPKERAKPPSKRAETTSKRAETLSKLAETSSKLAEPPSKRVDTSSFSKKNFRLTPPDFRRGSYTLSLTISESAEAFATQDGLSVSLESLSLSNGSLRHSCGSLSNSQNTLANSRGSLENSRGSLANSRGSLALNHAILSNARATLSTNPCDGSFLGSSTFLPDYSFHLDSNEHVDDNIVEQNPTGFFVGSVNSVWSREPVDFSSPAFASKDATSDESVSDPGCTTIQSKVVSAEHFHPIKIEMPVKRILHSGEDQSTSSTDAAVSSKRVASPKRQLSKWTEQEDERLEAGIKKYGIPNWVMVAKHVKTRNNKMCAQRWRNCLRPETKAAKKGKWSEVEDEQLRQIVRKYGCGDGSLWEKASEGMRFTRNSKQCRERWTNFLDPTLRLGPWTKEEDDYLLHLHSRFGNAWKKFASILTGRSAERIRRRFSILTGK